MKKIYTILCLFTLSFLLNAQTTDRLPLVEGFSSNTCGPCASFNSSYSPIIENNNPNEEGNAGVAVIKYQMDWPSPGTDPSFNNDGDNRRSFYQVSGIPAWLIDANQNNGTQAEIDARKNTPAELEINAAYTVTGNTIDINIELNPLSNLGSGARLYIVLTNKYYTYSGGTNGETEFHHIMRDMITGPGGMYLSALNAGTPITHNESYTYTVASGTPLQNSYDLWNSDFEIIVWVQKTASKEVFNAAVASEGILGIEEGDTDDFGMVVYPNPVQNNATVMFDGSIGEKVTMQIHDNLGKLISSETICLSERRTKINLNTTDFEAGLYHISLIKKASESSTRLLITK